MCTFGIIRFRRLPRSRYLGAGDPSSTGGTDLDTEDRGGLFAFVLSTEVGEWRRTHILFEKRRIEREKTVVRQESESRGFAGQGASTRVSEENF